MKTNCLLISMLCMLIGVLPSCNQKVKENNRIVIAVIPKVDNEIFNQVKQSAIQEAKNLGIILTWEAPSSSDGSKQKEIIENLIHYKVDGILISCNDADMLREPINKAIKAGIKVGTFDSDSPFSDRLFYVGTDHQKAGKVCAETMMRLFEETKSKPNQIIVLGGGASAHNMSERLTGFRSALKQGVISEVLYSFEIPDYGKELLSINLLPEKKITGLQMLWGVPVLNGVDSIYVLDNFIKNGGVSVFFDVSKPLLNYIKKHPNTATMKQDFRSMGHDGVDNMYNAIIGKPYELQILYDVKVIDKNNVEDELSKL